MRPNVTICENLLNRQHAGSKGFVSQLARLGTIIPSWTQDAFVLGLNPLARYKTLPDNPLPRFARLLFRVLSEENRSLFVAVSPSAA